MAARRAEETGQVVLLVGPRDGRLKSIREALQVGLGLRTVHSRRAENISRRHDLSTVDLLILQAPPRSVNAIDQVTAIRRRYAGPVLVLFEQKNKDAEIGVLEEGADKVLPISTPDDLLAAHVQSLLRRAEIKVLTDLSAEAIAQNPLSTLRVSDLLLDAESLVAKRKGRVISLSIAEFKLLWTLATQGGFPVDRPVLYTAATGKKWNGQCRSLDVLVARVRRKLEEEGIDTINLETVYGQGYRMVTLH